MTVLTVDMARKLMVADAERAVYSASGELGMARRYGRPAAEVAQLERKLAEARERLAIEKRAAS